MTKEFLTECIKLLHEGGDKKNFSGMCGVAFKVHSRNSLDNGYEHYELRHRIHNFYPNLGVYEHIWPLNYDGMQKRVQFLSQWRDELEEVNIQTLTIHG